MTTTRATLAVVLALTAASGCRTNPCPSAGEFCENGHAVRCEENDYYEFVLKSDTNCVAQGQICVSTGSAAACTDDVPCSASRCEGSWLVTCASGHLFSKRDCAASTSTPSTCATAPGGSVACVYTESPCPASGDDAFCSADGLTRWTGCSAGYGYPPTTDSACYGGVFVCAAGNGATECVLGDRIPCDPNGLDFCSADGTNVYVCGATGFAARLSQRCYGGQVCGLVLITSGPYAGQHNAVCR